MDLTEEQKARIEHNKEIAKQKYAERQKRLALQNVSNSSNIMHAASTSSATNAFLSISSNKATVPVRNNGFNYRLSKNPAFKTKVFEENISELPSKPTLLTSGLPTVNIQLFIHNKYRLKLLFKPYHDAVVNVLNSLVSKQYNPSEKLWTFNIGEYTTLLLKLKQIRNIRLEIDDLPSGVFQDELANKPELDKDVLLDNIDANLLNLLFPYQKEGVRFGIKRNGRLMVADEMGLGKTIQALAIANYYKNEWPLLIVCPSSVKFTWKQQIEKFLPSSTDVFIIEKSSSPLPTGRSTTIVVIMSYDLMKIREKDLKKSSFYDESHFLKDIKAQRTKAAISLSSKATRLILLSGTPALSRPVELFSQIRLIDCKIFPNFMEFARRYCNGREGKFQYEAKGATNTDELAAILTKSVMIRRLKKDVLHELPEKRREIVYLTGDKIDSNIKSIKQAKVAYLKAAGKNDTTEKHQSLMTFYSETANIKAQPVTTYILENYFYEGAEHRKILIFAHHQIILDTIEASVQKKDIKYMRIDGTTNPDKRFQNCEKFQNDPQVMIAILSITAAGVGITLTAASVVVFAELHWNPGHLAQAEDRAHRVGQRDSVLIKYILAKNTADDEMFPLIQKKLDVLSSVNLSSDSYRDATKLHQDCSNRDISNYMVKKTTKNDTEDDEIEVIEPNKKRQKSV